MKAIMHVSARVENRSFEHTVTLKTNGNSHTIRIPPKATGYGSSANGGELLAQALATCYCNDLYREAAARGVPLEGVDVEVHNTLRNGINVELAIRAAPSL